MRQVTLNERTDELRWTLKRPHWFRLASFGVASVLTVGLLVASWLSASLYWTTWLGLALFFVLVTRVSPRKAFGLGTLIPFAALVVAFHWAPAALGVSSYDIDIRIAWALFLVVMVWDAIPLGIVAAFASRQLAKRATRLWLIPVLWVSLEFFWPRVFPWRFAHSQTGFLSYIQFADWFGAAGLSFLLFAVVIVPAAMLALRERKRSKRERSVVIGWATCSVLLFVGAVVHGNQEINAWENDLASSPESIRVGIIQVDPSYVESIAKMRERTLPLHEDLDLVCWPESTLGVYSFDLNDFRDPKRTRRLSRPPAVDLEPAAELACQLIAGGKSFKPGAGRDGPFYQTAFLILPRQAIAARYLKRTLMPVGEYIPGQDFLPCLREWGDLDISVTGKDARPLVLHNGTKVGMLICYEDTVPNNAREAVLNGAEVLVALANASAFEDPLALELHMRLALLRAVENRRFFARCTATGVSCIISPVGRVTARTEANTEATLQGELPLINTLTPHTRFGHYFAAFCLAITVAAVLTAVIPGVYRRWRVRKVGKK